MNSKIKSKEVDFLFDAILQLKNEDECYQFFEDLCTNKELEQMAERAYAARLLIEGKTYTQIIAQADISSATLSRVSQCVQYGKGYSQFLK